jgi:hypothetical protein
VSACTLGPLIVPMLMSLVFSCVRDSIKSSREGIFQVALEVNMTVWNVDTNTENSGPSLERMVRTICFSSFDLSTPQALSCDSKSLNFVKKSWILSKIFGSNVSKFHLQHVSPHLILFSKDPFQGGPGFIGSLTRRYVKKEIGRNKTANCSECLIHAI